MWLEELNSEADADRLYVQRGGFAYLLNNSNKKFFGKLKITLATSSTSSDVEIYAFDQNPAGSDKGNEWVTLCNPLNERADIGNWTLETADGERETIPKGTTLYSFAYYVRTWLTAIWLMFPLA